MKRIITISLCLLLLAILAVPAFAAGSAGFSMSASNKSLNRGDTVTLTVSVSCSEPATSYGLQMSYDTGVFELVNGSCTVGGTLVTSFNNGFAFMFQTPTAYSGTVGTVTLKVKDTAAFGNYTVSGAASVKNGTTAVSASGCSVSLSVVCNHSYGAWTEAGSNHQQTCSICQGVKTEAHTWDAGKVTKPASCKEAGEKSFTCTTCNATKTEAIAKTEDHTFGNLTAVDDNNHKDVCSICNKEVQEGHKWDAGKVTKPATCKEDGVKTFTCSGCKHTKTEKITKTDDHTYGKWQNADSANHKHICSVCQAQETAAHTWDKGTVTKKATCKEEGEKIYTCTACGGTKIEKIEKTTTHTYGKWQKADADTHKRICSVCQTEETAKHAYKTTWSKSATEHYHECSDCKDKKDVEAHKPGAEATETKAQTCTTCGYVIKAALAHKHSYATNWTTDDAGHWYKCSGCEEKGSYAEHDFENACDPDCSVCGFTRETGHSFAEAWTNDETNHWHVCSGCGEKEGEAAHIPGEAATDTKAQTCTICGYELAPALKSEATPEQSQTPAEAETTAPAAQSQNGDAGNNKFPWWIVIVAAVAVIGGVVIVVKKKGSK